MKEEEKDPMAMMMSKIDGMIKAGGASVDDLEELKMDMEDMMGEDVEEPEEEMPEDGQKGKMAGLIIKIQNKGKGE